MQGREQKATTGAEGMDAVERCVQWLHFRALRLALMRVQDGIAGDLTQMAFFA
jgi:hypothetical protein